MSKTKKHITNENYFDAIDTPNKAYSLGVLMADGSISRNHQVSISQKVENADLLNYLCDEFGFIGYYNLNPKRVKGGSKYYPRLSFVNKRLSKSLQRVGMIPSKTHKCRLPKLSKELMPYLVLGWFDGDGCIHISKQKSGSGFHTVFQISGTRKSMIDMYHYLNDLGIRVKYRHHDKNGKCYIVYAYAKETIKKIYDLFYSAYETNKIGMVRKKEIFEDILNTFNYVGTSETWFDDNNDFKINKYIKNKHIFNSCLIGMTIGSASVMSASRFRVHKGRSSIEDFILEAKVQTLKPYIEPVSFKKGLYAHYRDKKKFKYLHDNMIDASNACMKLPDNIIHRVNEWTLFFMYLDKGRVDNRNNNYIIINMKNFSRHDCEKLSTYLHKKYNLDLSVIKCSGNTSIKVTKKSLLEFIREPYAVFNTVLEDIVEPLKLPTPENTVMI